MEYDMPLETEALFKIMNLKDQSGIKQRIKNQSSEFRDLRKSKNISDGLTGLLFSLPVLKF